MFPIAIALAAGDTCMCALDLGADLDVLERNSGTVGAQTCGGPGEQ